MSQTSGRDQTAAKPKATVVCRNCGDAHFTYQCPHKDKLGAIKDIAPKKEEPAEEAYVVHGTVCYYE